MENKELKVLWTSKKNGNGICVDSNGSEYYVDSSIACFSLIKRNDLIQAKVARVSGILCVRDIDYIEHGMGKLLA